jgi:hypothetical protein
MAKYNIAYSTSVNHYHPCAQSTVDTSTNLDRNNPYSPLFTNLLHGYDSLWHVHGQSHIRICRYVIELKYDGCIKCQI